MASLLFMVLTEPLFAELSVPRLAPLPPTPRAFTVWTKVQVGLIELAEEKQNSIVAHQARLVFSRFALGQGLRAKRGFHFFPLRFQIVGQRQKIACLIEI